MIWYGVEKCVSVVLMGLSDDMVWEWDTEVVVVVVAGVEELACESRGLFGLGVCWRGKGRPLGGRWEKQTGTRNHQSATWLSDQWIFSKVN